MVNHNRSLKLFIDIIFSKDILEENKFRNINLENLIMISSTYLMIPTLFSAIRKKKYISYFPKDFINYVSYIYKTNKERNKILTKELVEIKKIFKNNSINAVFLKSAYYLDKNILKDIGEKMIGDIDFIIPKVDLDKTILALKKKGYKNSYEYIFWKTKHSRRLINNKKIFALEPHTEILLYRKKNILNSLKYIQNVDNKAIELAKVCILNSQINDYCHLCCKIDFRSLYDLKLILNYYDIDLSKLNNKYYRRFFFLSNFYGITNIDLKISVLDSLYLNRHMLKNKYKYFRQFDNLICSIIINAFILPMKFIEFSINRKYRKHGFKKIKSILNRT